MKDLQVTLERVTYSKKPVLRQLMELYLYDFTQYLGMDISEEGYYGYPYLDHYWTEKGRHPYFIRVSGVLAGFVLINQQCQICPVSGAYSIGEFFVLKKYRRHGVGERAAKKAIEKYPGWWEILWIPQNKGAGLFWKKALASYAKDKDSQVRFVRQEERQGLVFYAARFRRP